MNILAELFTTKNDRMRKNHAYSRKLAITRYYERRITELYLNRFKWTVPDSINKRYLEYTLLHRSMALFFFDETFGRYMALPATWGGQLNMYLEPTRFDIVAPGYNFAPRTPADSVPIWANYTRQPDLDIITVFADRLATIDRTIEINSHNARKTRIISTAEGQRLSTKNFDAFYEKGHGVIEVDKTFNVGDIGVLDLGISIKDDVNELYELKVNTWNECMTMLGINNGIRNKNERLIVDEVNANNNEVLTNRRVALNAREEACEAINKMWPGIGVSVEMHESLEATFSTQEVNNE